MPGYNMTVGFTSSQIVSLLVLKPCDFIDLTCHAGSKATQEVVNYLRGSHERAGSPLQKAVIAELLANSIRASRLVQGLSDELSSITWWPRRGVELYNALQERELEAIRSKLPKGVITPAQGTYPVTKESTGMTSSLIMDAAVLTEVWMTLPPHTYIAFETGEYALWVAVVVGAQTGLLHVDATLQGIFHTFMPRLYPYQATSAAQPVLDCFQANGRLKRRVQQLLTSWGEDRLAALNRMKASKKKANRLRLADWQEAQALKVRRDSAMAKLRQKVQQAEADRDGACQGQEVLKGEVATLLQRSLAAEQLAGDRLLALTGKEQEVTHLHQSLCEANTALADTLEEKKKAREDASPSPVSMSGEDLLPPFIESCASPVVGCGPTDADRHADPPASDETPEAQHADMFGIIGPATMSGARAGESSDVHQQQQLQHQAEPVTSEQAPSSSIARAIGDDAGTPSHSASHPTGDCAAGRESGILSKDGDGSPVDSPVPDAAQPSSSHGADADEPPSSSQESHRSSASVDLGRSAPVNNAAATDTMDAEDDNPSSSPPSLYPSLTPSDARVSADLAQPALASASSSAVSSSPVATGPAPAASAGAIPDQAIQVRLAEDTARASSSSFDPQPAAVHPQSADAGPQPATVDALPVFEVEHVIVEAKEGPQWNVQAAPWLPGQADAEVQQQQAGSARKDSSLLPSTSMSEAAATKQQLQRQLGNLNGQAAPFVPNVKAAKRLQQEAAGMKEAAGLFEKQRAGLLQQQQADSPKISAVKGGLDLLPDAQERVKPPSLSPHSPEGKPRGVVPQFRPSSAWTSPQGAPPAGPPAVPGPHRGPPPFGPLPPAWGPPPSGPPPVVQGKPPSGPRPGAWGPPPAGPPPDVQGKPPSGPPPGVWGQPPSAPFHGPAPHAANMASGKSRQMGYHPQAATMQPAFAVPVLMQPGYMAPAHLPTPSMGLPYMQQAVLMQQRQAAAMHMHYQQQQQLFMMQQQPAPMHSMDEQPYRYDPPGQLPLGARQLRAALKQQEKQRSEGEKQTRTQRRQ